MFPDQVLLVLFLAISDLPTLLAIQLTCKKWRALFRYIKKEKRNQLSRYKNTGLDLIRTLGKTKKVWVNDLGEPEDEDQQEPEFVLWKKENLSSGISTYYSKEYDQQGQRVLGESVHNVKKIKKYVVTINNKPFSFDPRNKYPLSRITRVGRLYYDRFLFLREITISYQISLYTFSLQRRRKVEDSFHIREEEYYIFRLKITKKNREEIYQFSGDKPISGLVNGEVLKDIKLEETSPEVKNFKSVISFQDGKYKVHSSFLKDKCVPTRMNEISFFL
jgi:hypothetical protein